MFYFRSIRTFALLVTCLSSASAFAGVAPAVADQRPGPGPVTPQTPHYDLEMMYAQGQMKAGLEVARARLKANPNDVDLYRHVARFMFEIGEHIDRTDTSVDKIAHYQEMYDISNKALELDPGNAHLLFHRGIALGRLSTTRGVLSSMFNIKAVETDWLAAAGAPYRYSALNDGEILPCDAYLTLGIFYRIVPESWVVGLLAGTRGDLDKSLANLERANSCQPGQAGTVKELGVTQMCMGTRRGEDAMIEKGKATLRKVLALNDGGNNTAIDKKHAKMLIADPDLACEYSRDGQQDLDESKLKKPE